MASPKYISQFPILQLKISNPKSKRKNNKKKNNFKSNVVPHYCWNFHKPGMLPRFSYMTLGSKRVLIAIRTQMKDIWLSKSVQHVHVPQTWNIFNSLSLSLSNGSCSSHLMAESVESSKDELHLPLWERERERERERGNLHRRNNHYIDALAPK